ncbi:MAG: sulfite exporter TauE/SafE family protein [Rhodospirillales bacterium]|nr:sulfite exporter TauE/SafE family protein [Rhodospirillales bacterium]
MIAFLDAALAHCADLSAASGNLPSVAGAVFMAGLIGGFTHCSLMCGPFVVAQMSRHLETVPVTGMSESIRFKSAILLPYHLGRMTTYALLGGIMGGIVGGLSIWWKTASGLVLLLAGLGMLASVAGIRIPKKYAPSWVLKIQGKVLHFAAPVTLSPFGWRGYILGLVLGLLPCGMVWSALLAAAGTAGALGGALVMACLAAGTVPGLFVAAVAGRSIVARLRIQGALAARVLAGVWLCLLSVEILTRG